MKKGLLTTLALGALTLLYLGVTAVATFGNIGPMSAGTLYQPEVPKSLRK